MFDMLIAGGKVIDGTGSPPFRTDVGIRNGRITEMGDLHGSRAQTVVDASDQVVTPGFIDMHSHSDFNLPVNPVVAGRTEQGVTTEVTGNCGFSPAPVEPEREAVFRENVDLLDSGLDYRWRTFGQFLAAMPPLAVNMAPLVGHVTIRCAAMGVENRPPNEAELSHMASLVAEAMEAGAFGFSTGLVYPPASFADTDEVVALATVAARRGGGYFVHMRNESHRVLEAIRESLEIGRRSGAHVQISHFKQAGAANWGRSGEMLALIDQAVADGVRVHCDQYPYTAGSTGLNMILPQWVHEGGNKALVARIREPETRSRIRSEMLGHMGDEFMRLREWQDVMIAESPNRPDVAGLNLEQLGQREGKAPVDALLDLLIADDARTLAIYFIMHEDDVRRIMRHPRVAVGSDGVYVGRSGGQNEGRPHPRYFSTFPRILGRYVREEEVLELPEAVRKMTSLTADILGLTDRGRVKVGMAADLVVFDAATILDNGDYADPFRRPSGIDTVLVKGIPVVRGGRSTGETPGVVLRRGT